MNPQDGGGSPGQCSPGHLLYEPTEFEAFYDDIGGLQMESSNDVQEEQSFDAGFDFTDAFPFDYDDSDKFYSASE
jgi:hypothetical protein